MPNTSIFVGVGAYASSVGECATDKDGKVEQELLRAQGKTVVVDESLQDAVTATTGSGPADFSRLVEAMIGEAKDVGLSDSDAKTLVLQTINSAAVILFVEGSSPSSLRENVSIYDGTTSAALEVFEESGLEPIVQRAMTAARDISQ